MIVHRRQLLGQWTDALSRFLGIPIKEIGQLGGGKRRITGQIDVAMVQSLCQRGVVDDVVTQYGQLIIDECHHISAVSFEQVVKHSKARFVTGLSATVNRKDGHHPIIFMQCGPVRYRTNERQQADARPFTQKVIVRTTQFRAPAHLRAILPAPIQAIYEALTQDHARNKLIVADVIIAMQSGRFPVILTERREHLDMLVNMLSAHIEHIYVMTGGMGKKQRRALKNQISAVPADVPRLIAASGRYLGEGFDDAQLDTLFLAMPIAWPGTLMQYVGRLHRLNDAKTDVVVFDYADIDVPVLARMHIKRRTGYKAFGYAITTPDKISFSSQLKLADL